MSPKEIDQAIDSLSEPTYSELSEFALKHWKFRSEYYALLIAVVAVFFVLCFSALRFVPKLWPGSVLVSIVTTLGLILVLLLMLKAVLSFRLTNWRVRRALRREFYHHKDVGAP